MQEINNNHDLWILAILNISGSEEYLKILNEYKRLKREVDESNIRCSHYAT